MNESQMMQNRLIGQDGSSDHRHPCRILAVLLTMVFLAGLLGGCSFRPSEIAGETTPPVLTTEEPAPSEPGNSSTSFVSAEDLFPASQFVDNGEKYWGYIDRTGAFVIAPAFMNAADFQTNGLAKVQLEDHFGLIDTQGNWVVQPIYDQIADFSSDRAVASQWGDHTTSDLIDPQGKVIASFSGTVGAFDHDQAQVVLADGSRFVINPAGEKVADASEPATGNDKLLYDQDFADGLKIVGQSVDYQDFYGLFDSDGQVVLPQEFAGIERLGDNLFAAARANEVIFWYRDLPKALFDKTGKQLSDTIYYDLADAGNGLISVSDLHDTYLLDATGQMYAKLPKLQGNGSIEVNNGLIRAMIEQHLAYYDLDGQLIWQEQATYTLDNGWQVTRKKESPDRFTVIFYPEISGLSDQSVQTLINASLKTTFANSLQQTNFDGAETEPGTAYDSVDFSVSASSNLLIVTQTGYFYPIGAAHGQPSKLNIHMDSQTGQVYTLKDLFMTDADYQTRLAAMVNQQIQQQVSAGDAYYLVEEAAINENDFKFGKDDLVLYFDPYEIAPYAAGFPTFKISYADIMDIIDQQGALWQTIQGLEA